MNAKQAISDAELMFHKNIKDDGHFDQYWQEKLNIANSKVRFYFFQIFKQSFKIHCVLSTTIIK